MKNEIKLSVYNQDIDYTKEETEIKSKSLYGSNSRYSIIPKANGLCQIDIIARLPSKDVVEFQFWPRQPEVVITPSLAIEKGVKHVLTFLRE